MWQLHQLPQTQKEGEIMKKLLFAIIAMASFALSAGAQKFALVDMEYILNHIPAYERAGEQLNQVSRNGRPKSRFFRKRPRLCTRSTSQNPYSFLTSRR